MTRPWQKRAAEWIADCTRPNVDSLTRVLTDALFERDALAAEVERLRIGFLAADEMTRRLHRYARHAANCDIELQIAGAFRKDVPEQPCSCGWTEIDAALAPTDGDKP